MHFSSEPHPLSNEMGTTIASCPGKVLTAGGYLVLDRSYEGFVISTPSRFYTVIREIGAAAGTQPGSENGQRQFKILVKSPQFQDGRWEYEATKESNESEWNVQFVNKEGCVYVDSCPISYNADARCTLGRQPIPLFTCPSSLLYFYQALPLLTLGLTRTST